MIKSLTVVFENPTTQELAAIGALPGSAAGSGDGAPGTASGGTSTAGSGAGTASGTASGTGTSTGTTTPPAPQPILHLPADAVLGADVDLGSGPDELTFQIGIEPATTQPNARFDVILDGVGIAEGLICAVHSGGVGGQRFTLRGDWGPGPHTIEQVFTDPAGGNATFNNGVQYNLAPCYANGGYDSRGVMSVNAVSVFLTKGHIINWTTQPVNASAPVGGAAGVSPALSTITAQINGTPHTDTLDKLLAVTPTGGTIELPAGKIVGTGLIPNACTVKGAGMGKTVIDATGLALTQGKGVLVPAVSGSVISDLTIMGATVGDDNGASVRQTGDGVDFTAQNIEVTGCQDGILAFGATVNLASCDFHDNGAGDGLSHEIYLNGDPTTHATLTDMTVTAGIKATHALKSRSGDTTITGGVYTGSKDTTGDVAGSTIDIPDGGLVAISNGTIALSPGQGNRLFLGFAMESAKNAAAGKTVTITNEVFDDQTGLGGIIQAGAAQPDAELVLSGCTYKGPVAPQLVGWGTVTGTIAKAA